MPPSARSFWAFSSFTRDEHREVLALVAVDHRLADERVGLEAVLEVLRRDVLAARGDDDVLLAVGDAQVARRGRSRRCRRSGTSRRAPATSAVASGCVVVALHHVGALDQDLAVRGDLHLGAGHRRAHRADPRACPGGSPWPPPRSRSARSPRAPRSRAGRRSRRSSARAARRRRRRGASSRRASRSSAAFTLGKTSRLRQREAERVVRPALHPRVDVLVEEPHRPAEELALQPRRARRRCRPRRCRPSRRCAAPRAASWARSRRGSATSFSMRLGEDHPEADAPARPP